ncbi:MAG TPA: hypothetical protein VK131_03840 [Candidatus Acidoferrales bacterium]|nr:hypothetical protein [Candidatus Acidoferrales bacterium]
MLFVLFAVVFYPLATLILAFIAGFGFRKGWDLGGTWPPRQR